MLGDTGCQGGLMEGGRGGGGHSNYQSTYKGGRLVDCVIRLPTQECSSCHQCQIRFLACGIVVGTLCLTADCVSEL